MKYIIASGLLGLLAGQAQAQQINPKEKLAAAFDAIQSSYVDSVGGEALADAAIRGMLTQLDPHSQYFSRRQMLDQRGNAGGSFVGIGIEYLVLRDTIHVTQVLPGGPAEKAGLLAGDRITKIDDVLTTGQQLTNQTVMRKLRGAANTPVVVEVYRTSHTSPLTLKLLRGPVPDNTVRAAYLLTPKVGYIALGIFGRSTRAEVDEALQRLKAQGMQDLVLDLQSNGGGYVEAAIGVADEFLKRDQLVYYKVGKDKGRDYYYAAGTGHFPTGRVVVLIDQNTASASELMTSALQDWDRAIIVGRRSFGKGLMQQPVPLFDGSVLELSGARYYAPTGRSLQKPYREGSYQGEMSGRYTSGELTDQRALPAATGPQYKTLVYKRPVYGSMGVVPDRFVPMDTIQTSRWLQAVIGSGLVSQQALEVASRQRTALRQAYPTLADFQQRYQVPAPVLDALLAAAARQNLPLAPERRTRLFSPLALELKGRAAAQLYADPDAYLQVVNQGNASIQEALRLLANATQYQQCLQAARPTGH